MKTILVLTDFSINSDYTAHYALKLAQKIEANLLLCNVYMVIKNEQRPAYKKWPLAVHEESSIEKLGALMAHLKTQIDLGDKRDFRPEINQYSMGGLISDTINDIVISHHIFMAVISMHRSNYLTSFLKTNHVWAIIKKASFPLLIIPYQVRYKDYKKIAFATDLTSSDIAVLNSLSSLAKYSDAMIIVTHVTDSDSFVDTESGQLEQFFKQDSRSINNPVINYRSIKNNSVLNVLTEVIQSAEIDMLVLTKRKKSVFKNLFKRSAILELANHSTKPLLIFPDAGMGRVLPVF
jgi:nucleotide-binding universal stress UspA family protein